jgi:hypothetical protein
LGDDRAERERGGDIPAFEPADAVRQADEIVADEEEVLVGAMLPRP